MHMGVNGCKLIPFFARIHLTLGSISRIAVDCLSRPLLFCVALEIVFVFTRASINRLERDLRWEGQKFGKFSCARNRFFFRTETNP